MVKNMNIKQLILNLLITNKYKEFTIREISKIIEKDYKNTYNAISELKEDIKIRKIGNNNLVKFKPLLSENIIITEIKRRNIKLANKQIKLINNDIKSFKNPFSIIILFGSYAKDKQTKNSDIDICVIHDNNEEYRKLQQTLEIHSKIELHGFEYKEFVEMLKDKSFNVGHEIVKDGVILQNIESYYEIIKYEGEQI